MKYKNELKTFILSRKTMHHPDDFLQRLLLHFDMLPHMQPLKWDYGEPLRNHFQKDFRWDIAFANKTCFPENMYWSRSKKTKSEGAFTVAVSKFLEQRLDTHADEYINSELLQTDIDSLIAYVKKSSILVKADLAGIELNSKQYRSTDIYSDKYIEYFHRGLIKPYTHDLRLWLYDVYWVTIFGDAYTRMFGMEKLLSVPAYKVERLNNDTVFIQLTENPSDMLHDFEGLQKIRNQIRDHLGVDAFVSPKKAQFAKGKGVQNLLRCDLSQPINGRKFIVPKFNLISDEYMDRSIKQTRHFSQHSTNDI